MGPSLRDHSSFVRPLTRDRSERPPTRDHGDHSLMIPSRTSSLHSRITQPIPSTLTAKANQRTPKTLTHAYMVCGVGREPAQWVKAPAPAQGKIGHMKGAVGQFWLPEILGSSPRLEQDNEIARSWYSAMRVSITGGYVGNERADWTRRVSLMMWKFVPAEPSHTACTTPSSSSKTHRIHSTASRCEYGQERTINAPRRFATCASGQNPIITNLPTRHTGSLTASVSSRDTPCTIFLETIYVACGSTGTRPPTSSTPRRFPASSASQLQD